MVQTYGVANEHEDAVAETNMSAESDALLGAGASARKAKAEGHATLQSCVGNLANTIIGSGECRDILRGYNRPSSKQFLLLLYRNVDFPIGKQNCSSCRLDD
jgi:hypothetical protein